MMNDIKISMPRMMHQPEMSRTLLRFSQLIMKHLDIRLSKQLKIRLRSSVLPQHILGTASTEMEIMLNWNASEEEILITLAHELIHIQQMCNGTYDAWLQTHSYALPYMERPWEIDAIRREKSVMLNGVRAMIAENPRLAKGWSCDSGRLSSVFRFVGLGA